MELYEKPKSAVCGATHSTAAFSIFSFSSALFRRFSPWTRTHQRPDPFSLTRGRDHRGRDEGRRKRERERRRGPVRSRQFLFFNGDYWNRPLRAGPHRVWAMFQLGIPTATAEEQREKERRRGGEREREREREVARSVKQALKDPASNRPPRTVNRRGLGFKTDSAEIPGPGTVRYTPKRLHRGRWESQESVVAGTFANMGPGGDSTHAGSWIPPTCYGKVIGNGDVHSS